MFKLLLFLTTLVLSSTCFAQQVITPKKYLYSDQWDMGAPSGYFGAANGAGLKVIHNYDVNPFAGTKCIRLKSNGKEAWSGFFALSTGKWKAELMGSQKGLANLGEYDELIVHIRAEKNTKVTLSFGEAIEPKTSLTEVAVTKEWKEVSIPIQHLQRTSINGLFGITLQGADTLYLDDIYFKGKITLAPNAPASITTPKVQPPLVPIKVAIKKKGENAFQLIRNGKPYYVKGAGGQKYLDRVKKYGGNSIRTWSHDDALAILDSAHKHNLTVMMGLWVQHERHGFDYNDQEAVYYQLQGFKDVVMKLKNHPALLCWGIGNEVDLSYTNTKVWYAIQDIAKMVHELDPNHPTTTVTAGLDAEEITLINERCPDIDFMSINTYGDLENVVPSGIRKAGWKGPYMITEWGPTGHWEIAKTSFDVPVEQNSSEKAEVYKNRYSLIASDTASCLGSYVFLWGNKQETTPTWYSMFLGEGFESEILDAMQYSWSKKTPANKAPSVKSFTIDGKKALDHIYLTSTEVYKAEAIFLDPEQKPLRIEWVFMPESTDKKSGGDFEKVPEAIPSLILEKNGGSITFKAPSVRGAYRLFVYAFDDDNNVAFSNIPFFIGK